MPWLKGNFSPVFHLCHIIVLLWVFAYLFVVVVFIAETVG